MPRYPTKGDQICFNGENATNKLHMATDIKPYNFKSLFWCNGRFIYPAYNLNLNKIIFFVPSPDHIQIKRQLETIKIHIITRFSRSSPSHFQINFLQFSSTVTKLHVTWSHASHTAINYIYIYKYHRLLESRTLESQDSVGGRSWGRLQTALLRSETPPPAPPPRSALFWLLPHLLPNSPETPNALAFPLSTPLPPLLNLLVARKGSPHPGEWHALMLSLSSQPLSSSTSELGPSLEPCIAFRGETLRLALGVRHLPGLLNPQTMGFRLQGKKNINPQALKGTSFRASPCEKYGTWSLASWTRCLVRILASSFCDWWEQGGALRFQCLRVVVVEELANAEAAWRKRFMMKLGARLNIGSMWHELSLCAMANDSDWEIFSNASEKTSPSSVPSLHISMSPSLPSSWPWLWCVPSALLLSSPKGRHWLGGGLGGKVLLSLLELDPAVPASLGTPGELSHTKGTIWLASVEETRIELEWLMLVVSTELEERLVDLRGAWRSSCSRGLPLVFLDSMTWKPFTGLELFIGEQEGIELRWVWQSNVSDV